jgi:hypothetical protein
MTRAVILTEKQWLGIYNSIAKNYPNSVLLISHKMKEVLGFTVRRHEEWVDRNVESRDFGYGTKYKIDTIHLDFYNEPKRTMFLLKYSDIINDSSLDKDII